MGIKLNLAPHQLLKEDGKFDVLGDAHNEIIKTIYKDKTQGILHTFAIATKYDFSETSKYCSGQEKICQSYEISFADGFKTNNSVKLGYMDLGWKSTCSWSTANQHCQRIALINLRWTQISELTFLLNGHIIRKKLIENIVCRLYGIKEQPFCIS